MDFERYCIKEVGSSDRKKTIEALQKENEILHPELYIVGAHRPKSTHSKHLQLCTTAAKSKSDVVI